MTISNRRNKKNINSWVRFLSIVLLLLSGQLTAQTFSTHVYTADASNIPNPERGFYKHTETNSGSYSFLNESTLRGYRAQGITLILRLFYLNDFVSKPISEQYLASMRQDFNTARAAGVKMIVRFAYTKKSTAPYGDATPAWALQHVEQLAPVLKQNGDVIAVVQAGFIGAWGEWYYTDHFSVTLGAPNATDWQNRRALVSALLSATPANRVVQVRTPAIKTSLVQSNEPLQESDAFTNAPKARIGHHNDCFLASDTDFGTYTGNIVAEKAYLETETEFLPIGGETCNESVPLSECPNALAQMEKFHWSYLNRDYHSGVLGSWQDGNCMPDVFQKLGYRFRMAKSRMQDESKPGGAVDFTIKLLNEGWATPFNARSVEIVLKHASSGKTFILPLQDDPRRWSQGDTIAVHVNGGLPPQIETGSYDVYLHLPDPEKTLYKNPDYSIRMANTDVWDDETGYNDLHHQLTVSKTASVPVYIGGDYFKALPSVGMNAAIELDGNAADWQDVPVLAVGVSDAHMVKAFNDADHLYFLVNGISNIQSFEINLDVDYAAASGELSSPWNTNYSDYRITATGISFYQSGSWSAPQAVTTSTAGDVLEVAVPKELLSQKSFSDQIEVAVKITTSSETIYLPVSDAAFASYKLLLIDQYALHSTSSGGKVILYWAKESPNVYRTIERSTSDDVYEKIAVVPGSSFTYIDQLTDNATVQYRTYLSSSDGFNVSAYADPVNESTSARPLYYVFETDGAAAEWEDVVPLSTAPFDGQTQAYRIFIDAQKLIVLLEGEAGDAYTLYFNMDNTTTGALPNPWNYTGFDYMLRNDSLYDIRGTSKVFATKGTRASSDGFTEVSVPVSSFANLGENTIIPTAGTLKIGLKTIFFPAISEAPAKFLRTLPAPTPSAVSVINSENFPASQLIVQWQGCTGCKGFIVERSISTPDDFSTVAVKNNLTYAYYDSDLIEGTTYYYRVSSYNDAGPSIPSAVLPGTPTSVTAVEEELKQHIHLYPNPVQNQLMIETETPGVKGLSIIDAKGQSWMQRSLSPVERTQHVDVSALPSGLYFVIVSGKPSAVFKIAKK
jgi:hypothetical protein